MKELVEVIAKSLVDYPEQVTVDEIIDGCQHAPIGMFNIQLLSKLLMNEWRFAVGYRITKNSIGFHYVTPVETVHPSGHRGFLKDLNAPPFHQAQPGTPRQIVRELRLLFDKVAIHSSWHW